MNEVFDLLQTRCAFDYRWASLENIEQPDTKRPLPGSVTRYAPPRDFVDFYSKYDGGRQNFSDHGWPSDTHSISLRLYSLEEMQELKKPLLIETMKLLDERIGARPDVFSFSNYGKELRLSRSFRKILFVGQIGCVSPSQKAPVSYLVYCMNWFYVVEKEELVSLGFHAADTFFASRRSSGNSLWDKGLAGILDKILDVILKGHKTIFDLRAETKKRQAEREKSREQAKECSLFQIIASAAADGELPADFSLPKSEGEDAVVWADGALDGVMLYHCASMPPSEEVKALLVVTIDCAGQGLIDTAEVQLAALTEKSRALSLVNLIGEYIWHNREKLDAAFLLAFATLQMMSSKNTECVKIGMAIMAALAPTEATNTVIRTLALCDEFTLYAIANMRRWENGNREIFETAQKTHGWGRIHAIAYLEPETEEIRSWLLREGINNTVLPAYSALECWKKCGAEERLNRDASMTREELSTIGVLLCALLGEGPMPGLSAVENGETWIRKYLDRLAQTALSETDRQLLRAIAAYYTEAAHSSPTVRELCEELLRQ